MHAKMLNTSPINLKKESIWMSFDEDMIQKVWEKGTVVPNYDEDKYRKDQCGAWIQRDKHGDRNHKWGWEIDHIDPDGGDELSNLRPLQWENNVATSDKGKLTCVKT